MIGFSARLHSVDVQSERRVWRQEIASRFVSLSDYVKSDGRCNLSTMVQADLSDVALAKSEEINPPKPDFVPEPDAPPVPDPERPHPSQPIPEVPTVPKPPIPPSPLARGSSRFAERGRNSPVQSGFGNPCARTKAFAISIDPAAPGSALRADFSLGDERRELEVQHAVQTRKVVNYKS